jgi:uncharacterized membrane protein YedE/YeeE
LHDLLLDRPPWFVVGPTFGLIVVAVYATINQQLGILGGFSAAVERAGGRSSTLGWKAWFLFGVVAGGFLFAVLSGAWRYGYEYGWLTRTFTGGWAVFVPVLLVLAGVLIGFGAKTAGGCTSGNGLAGCSLGSPASLVATASFFSTAIGVSFVLRWLGAG